MIRPLRITDLEALVDFHRRASTNLVVTWGRWSNPRWPLWVTPLARPGWGGNRHTWVYKEGWSIHGIVSARALGSGVWEVDYLLLDKEKEHEVSWTLLNQLGFGIKETAKYRLCLAGDSPWLGTVRRAGFSPTGLWNLYRRMRPAAAKDPPLPLRPQHPQDEYPLFQLYNTVFPLTLRQMEAMTFAEWQMINDQRLDNLSLRQFVAEKEGSLIAWVGVSSRRHAGYFEALVHPAEAQGLAGIFDFILEQLSGKSPILGVTPSQSGLREALHNRDFEALGEFTTFMKDSAIRLRQPAWVTAQA
ncbi:MAG: hypothetical protein HY664_08005 [Chloroflexi bacterium]|nr:hypothetical protein [Chloroflexota bacterium]